ncbi:MAG: winged helix-turn-helix transcriptional regulator [Promethearchaeota archaeon]
MTQEDKDTSPTNHLSWHCLQHVNINECSGECYLQEAFMLFGKKHTLSIIRLLLLHDKLRFNEIEKMIGGSPKTITDRLRELESYGLVEREMFNEIPIRVEYSLTKPGRDLESMFETISIWVRTWVKESSTSKS